MQIKLTFISNLCLIHDSQCIWDQFVIGRIKVTRQFVTYVKDVCLNI